MNKSVVSRPFVYLSYLLIGSSVAAASILGSAQGYAVLGGSTITNTGPTTLNGNVGLYPGTSITGSGSITFVGASTIHNDDGSAMLALRDVTAAYSSLASLPYSADLTGQNLGGLTLTPGVYRFASSAQLTGTLTLDAMNMANALFVFQIGSTLTTASNSNVRTINGTSSEGIYFQVGSSATLGTGTTLAGNVLALSTITLASNAEVVCGRALAQTGAITTDNDIVSNNCTTYNANSSRADFGSNGFSGGVLTVPEPGSFVLWCGSLFVLFALKKKSPCSPISS